MSEAATVPNGFRRRNRPMFRRELTSVMDEIAPAVIQHAELIKSIQDKIRQQDEQIDKLKQVISMRTRYRLHRACGSSWIVSLWRAL